MQCKLMNACFKTLALGLIGLTLSIGTALKVEAASVPLTGSGLVHVVGNKILDDHGQPLVLKGVNIHTYYYQYAWDKTAPLKHATEADIKYLKSLGVNSIRLGLHWQYFRTKLGYQLIDNYMQWCENAGIYLILDMHVTPTDSNVGQGKIWNNPVAQQKFVNLWKAIATRYADKKTIVGYDIFNEPAPNETKEWWDLATTTLNAIRQVDKGHIIFVQAPLGNDESFRLMNDTNVVYSFHHYKPYLVSYSGYQGAYDSKIPSNPYPGLVLNDVYQVGWAKGKNVVSKITEWTQLDSGDITVPAGVEFAALRLDAAKRIGEIWFDDLSITQNGAKFAMSNPNLEQASVVNHQLPASWRFSGTGDFSGTWDRTVNRPTTAADGIGSLKITGSSGGGSWSQVNQFYTEPLVKVKAGDKIRFQVWVYAPEMERGEFGIRFDYFNGSREYYDKARLTKDLQPYLTWASSHNVPLYVGEFGALSSAPGASRYNLVRDTMSIMNTAGVSWSLWAYRDLSAPYFGLYLDQKLDKRLVAELKKGLE